MDASNSNFNLVRSTLLDLFSHRLNIPLVLYDVQHNEEVVSSGSEKLFTEYCKVIRSTPLGHELCNEDHKKRGKINQGLVLNLCHAGLLNFSLPILISNTHVATILGGQMIADGARRGKAVEHHRITVSKFSSDINLQSKLRETFNTQSGLQSNYSTAVLVEDLRSLFEWLYATNPAPHDEQTHFLNLVRYQRTDIVEKVRHEFLIRFQPVLSRTERILNILTMANDNLLTSIDVVRCRSLAEGLMRNVKLLRIVSLNMGGTEYLGEYNFHKVDISRILRECAEVYQDEAEYKNIKITLDLDSCFFQVSRAHLICALTNLIDNSIKYSYFGSAGRLRSVNIIGKIKDASYNIEITNYGIGILPEEIEKIWEGGYRGIQTRDEHRTGSGAGCGIAKEIIQKHGGQVMAQSKMVNEQDVESPYVTTIQVKLPIRLLSEYK